MTKRREYGTGSTYQRKSDWRWVGTVEHGYSINGKRRRVVVTSKGCEGGCRDKCPHRAEIRRRLRDKKTALDKGQATGSRVTVKAWADIDLKTREAELRPKALYAYTSPVRNWIVPTIGHRRLDALTPADIRAVHEACRAAGRQGADVHRVLMTMLRRAIAEGHTVPPRVLMVKTPTAPKSDRQALEIDEGLAMLKAAAELPHGTRWLVTLLYGLRKGECLGLTWDAIDFDAGAFGEIVIEWQLQTLPYNVRFDRSSGFRVPDGYEARHLVDAYHLVRPKSRQGFRVAPLLEPVRDGLLKWREVAPANPWGLVWPGADGRPARTHDDDDEWHALQGGLGIGHPAGRYYHVHECRNFAATMLMEAGVDGQVIKSLLGHSSLTVSRGYMTVRRAPLLDALQRVGKRLELG